MQLEHPPRLPLAQRPTPLQPMPRATARWGNGRRLWVKRDDLTGSVLSGNKVRKLEYVLGHARANDYPVIITCGGLQSNHCRSTALACAQLGLRCHLILRGVPPAAGEADGNYLLDKLSGAEISIYGPADYQQRLPELLLEWQDYYHQRGLKALIVPTGASDGLGIWGYIAAAEEIAVDIEAHGLNAVTLVHATGSGGTQAGLCLGSALLGAPFNTLGVAVCDDSSWFERKIAADCADWSKRHASTLPPVQVAVNDAYIGPGYGLAGPEVFAAIAELAALEGLILDPVYTGKAFTALTQELRANRLGEAGDDIVFLHTGGVFGLFPQREHFASPSAH